MVWESNRGAPKNPIPFRFRAGPQTTNQRRQAPNWRMVTNCQCLEITSTTIASLVAYAFDNRWGPGSKLQGSCFHIIGDKLINPIVRVHIPIIYKDSLLKVGMTIPYIPPSFDPGTGGARSCLQISLQQRSRTLATFL